MSKEAKEEIDLFVNFVISEMCQGCTECEPRLPEGWMDQGLACTIEGKAKWLMALAKEFKEGSKK